MKKNWTLALEFPSFEGKKNDEIGLVGGPGTNTISSFHLSTICFL